VLSLPAEPSVAAPPAPDDPPVVEEVVVEPALPPALLPAPPVDLPAAPPELVPELVVPAPAPRPLVAWSTVHADTAKKATVARAIPPPNRITSSNKFEIILTAGFRADLGPLEPTSRILT
jgi:hypothetical protein